MAGGHALRGVLLRAPLVGGACAVVVGVWLAIGAAGGKNPLAWQIYAVVFVSVLAVAFALMRPTARTRQTREILAHGHEGWATIRTIREGGLTDLDLDLEVTIPGSDSYVSIVACDTSYRNKYAEGQIISVIVAGDDRGKIILREPLPR